MGCSDLFNRRLSWCNCKFRDDNTTIRLTPDPEQLGAYLVDSSFGRRWSLAGSTFFTAFFCVVFVNVDGPLLLKASTVGTSLASTTMWGILYGWTPEIFSTNVRGSACGFASALSRMCVHPS